MSPLTETLLFVFGLIALGYLAGWTGYMKVASGDGLSEFAVAVAMPVLLFKTMAHSDFHGSAPWALWAAYFTAAAVAWAAGHFTTTRIFGRESQAGVVGGVATAFSNLVLLGIPFMLGIFGQKGVDILSLIISVHLPIMMMASIVLFQIFGRSSGAPIEPLAIASGFLRNILMNPLVVGILAGLAWRAGGLPLTGIAFRFVDSLAGIAGTVALFAMGLGLRKFGISGNVRLAVILSAFKLFLMPAAALAMALALGLPPLSAKVAVAAASLPSGVNSYLIATQFGAGQALASNQMSIATAFAVITTSFWLMLATAIFG